MLAMIPCAAVTGAQENNDTDRSGAAAPTVDPTPPAETSAGGGDRLTTSSDEPEISRQKREQAYAKLLEAQRYIWSIRRVRSEMSIQTGARLAKDALRKAIELDPNLAEAYTALAELALSVSPQDIEEAITLSETAVRLDPDNFGAHRLLGRLYTIKSNLGRDRLNQPFAEKAIRAWREITRLDPRYAEGWAFLSAFYQETGRREQRLEALRNWMSAATPLETGFYSRVMVRDGELSNETASLKLGEALMESGRTDEALGVLTRAVSDSPENVEAVELLGQALETAPDASLDPAVRALRQAVYANPENFSLRELLAKTLARSGSVGDAAKFINDLSGGLVEKDPESAAGLQVTLGDIYAESGRLDEALAAYGRAMRIRGISDRELATEDERDFALLVLKKMIDLYKSNDRLDEAAALIERSRPLFGRDDLLLDREYIQLLRDGGQREEALKAVRSARARSPFDYNLIRTEASVLTDLGRVEEGVALIRELVGNKPENSPPSIMYDEFINNLFISNLYLQSNRNKEAIEAARKAISTARGKESRQIGQLSLASALQSSGDFTEAETILREVLRETPQNPIALNNLGYLYLESGRKYEEALGLIRQAVKMDPRNPSFLDSLGWAYFKLEKFEEAEKQLEKAIRYNVSSAVIYEHLGEVYLKTGKTRKAVEAFRKALTLATNPVETARITRRLAGLPGESPTPN